jgi:hypothetical protein
MNKEAATWRIVFIDGQQKEYCGRLDSLVLLNNENDIQTIERVITRKTREQLRTIARMNGVKRGRNTEDTINNLRAAGLSHLITNS